MILTCVVTPHLTVAACLAPFFTAEPPRNAEAAEFFIFSVFSVALGRTARDRESRFHESSGSRIWIRRRSRRNPLRAGASRSLSPGSETAASQGARRER